MAVDYKGLFTTPEQLRQSRIGGIQNRQAAISGMGGSYDALLGQIAAGGGTSGAMIAEGIKGMFGMKTPEEARAAKVQERLKEAKNDYAGLMALGQELMNDGNMQEAYAAMQMAQEVKPEAVDPVNILDTNDNKNIAAIAKYEMQCDINDPKCFAEARKRWIDQKRENAKELVGYKGLVKKRGEMKDAADSVVQANNALKVLDSGDVNIGAFPNTRQGVMKLMATVFPSWEKANQTVANTDLLISQTKLLAGQLLSTGMFGDGTAISERDLATAERIAGASETLTPLAMKEILEFNAKVQQKKIQGFNQSLQRYNPEFFARTIEGSAENFMVTIPAVYNASNVGKPKEPEQEQVIYNDMMFTIPKGAQAGKIKGRLVYKLDGKYYDMNTGEEIQ